MVYTLLYYTHNVLIHINLHTIPLRGIKIISTFAVQC